MSDEEIENVSLEERILKRHKQEAKQMQGKILALKKSVNKDKKRKKEILDQIARLEDELCSRHAAEIAEIRESEGGQPEISPDEIQSLRISDPVNGIQEEDAVENNQLDGEEEMSDTGTGNRRMSKAEKRRQKKVLASKEREAMIKEAEKANRFCARNVEVDKIKKILKDKGLQMHEIKPDGNCLYAAVSHQLSPRLSVSELRSQTSRFIRSRPDDFLPFITDPATGDILTTQQFDQYCKLMEETPAWGGQPELRALSQVSRKRIEVLQAEGSAIVFGDEFGLESGVLLAYYRHYYGLGEHYNSVDPLNQSNKTSDFEQAES